MPKKPKKSLSSYPYLCYWAEDWAEMETTNGDYNQSRLTLLNEGGIVYEDKGSQSLEEAFEKAEVFLRGEGSMFLYKEDIEALEEEYKELDKNNE